MTIRLRNDDGTTIIELSMVVALLGVVLALVLSILTTSQTNLERNISRTSSNDEIRLAVQSLDREVRSGNVVYDPAQEVFTPGDVESGMSIRIYTQSNSAFKCVQWRITSNKELQRRSWTPGWQSDPANLVNGWRTVATGIRNRADAPATGAAFSRPQTNLLAIDLWSNSDDNGTKGKSVQVKASVSGRNTIFYSSNQFCGPPVPNPSHIGTGGSQVPAY